MRIDHRWWIWPAVCLIPLLALGWPLLHGLLGYAPREGDLVFQSLPRNALVDAIEGISGSPYSHCGLVVRRDGGWYVIEALGTVRETPLSAWIRRGRGTRFDAFRLRTTDADHVARAIARARTLLGRHYDVHYRFDNDDIYCSELVYLAWRDGAGITIGATARLGDLAWRPFEATITAIEQGPVPLAREMITPAAMAADGALERCFSGLR
jgi:uncharacterized protein YycO